MVEGEERPTYERFVNDGARKNHVWILNHNFLPGCGFHEAENMPYFLRGRITNHGWEQLFSKPDPVIVQIICQIYDNIDEQGGFLAIVRGFLVDWSPRVINSLFNL